MLMKMISLWVLAILFGTSCKVKEKELSEERSGESTLDKACVGMQGNGIKFPSHVGTFVALLENDITPAVALGGSSGSIVGGAVMGLLENTSLGQNSIRFQGRQLTKTQKAGLVLAAIPDILNSFLFLPAFNEFGLENLEVTPAIIRLLIQNQFGHVLAGASDSRVVSIEATVGQSVLLTDFLMHQNFSSVLNKNSYAERRAETFRLWKIWAGIKETDFMAIFEAASDVNLNAEPTSEQEIIADRFFRLFQQDIVQANASSEVGNWKNFIRAVNSVLKNPIFAQLKKKQPSDRVKPKLYIPDPALLWNAYRGFSKDGKFLNVPSGLIIHSTFRKSKIQLDNTGSISATEAIGPDALYQGYVASDAGGKALASELIAIKKSLASADRGFLPYYLDSSQSLQKLGYAYPADRVLVFKSVNQARGEGFAPGKNNLEADVLFREGRRGLSHAIAFSAGEPGPFRRQAVFTDGEDVAVNDVRMGDGKLKSIVPVLMSAPKSGEKVSALVAFGGWSENVPISTLAMLKSCDSAKYFVTSGKDGLGNSFQENAIRASLRGWNFIVSGVQNFVAALGSFTPKGEAETKEHFANINQNVVFSRSLVQDGLRFKIEAGNKGAVGSWVKDPSLNRVYFSNNIEFDIPSEAKVDSKTIKSLNGAIGGDKAALMLASYQKTYSNMSSGSLSQEAFHKRRINSFGSQNENSKNFDFGRSSPKLYEMTTVGEIQAATESIR